MIHFRLWQLTFVALHYAFPCKPCAFCKRGDAEGPGWELLSARLLWPKNIPFSSHLWSSYIEFLIGHIKTSLSVGLNCGASGRQHNVLTRSSNSGVRGPGPCPCSPSCQRRDLSNVASSASGSSSIKWGNNNTHLIRVLQELVGIQVKCFVQYQDRTSDYHSDIDIIYNNNTYY